MHQTIKNLIEIQSEIKQNIQKLGFINYDPNIIAVSKTFKIEYISNLIDFGHLHFGENKVQEANDKWKIIKEKNNSIKLHMIGKLQTNKVKQAIKTFDYIHSVDSKKLAQKISIEQKNLNKKVQIFIQVNLANEVQKSGVKTDELLDLLEFCKLSSLKVLGLMCLPPFDEDSDKYFYDLKSLNDKFDLKDLSMGMSHDYLKALKYKATFLRIGSKIFGNRN